MKTGEMTLNTLEFLRLLPRFMTDDLAVKALAGGIDELAPEIANACGILTTWDKINELSEEELDELAWELNILWYDTGANVQTKRELILNSDKVYKHLGTKWAVENVINTYFGDGYLREWFEYEGNPGYFRVYSTNPTVNNERLTEFLNILEKVKRHSAILEGIYITLTGEMKLSAGCQVHDTSFETHKIGAKL